MFTRKEIIAWILITFVGITLAWACRLEAGEWNEKPVMCAFEKETNEVLEQKGEKLFYMGKGFTKVRTETGLAHQPVTIPFRLYVNEKTGTFTIIEYHPDYKSYCVIAYGIDFQDFRKVL